MKQERKDRGEILRDVYPEPTAEILRFAQNDRQRAKNYTVLMVSEYQPALVQRTPKIVIDFVTLLAGCYEGQNARRTPET